MLVQAKRIEILMILTVNLKFFLVRYFPSKIENMISTFLLSYRNICESLGEQQMLLIAIISETELAITLK